MKTQYAAVLDDAVANLTKAVQLDPAKTDAMSQMSLVLRERAELMDTPDEYAAQIKAASEWQQRSKDAQQRAAALKNFGDPLAKLESPGASNGPGPSAASTRAGVFKIGGDVSKPILIQKVEPEYTETALNAKFQGTTVLSIVVEADGSVRDIQVVRPLGLGLDEKAVEAVRIGAFVPDRRMANLFALLPKSR